MKKKLLSKIFSNFFFQFQRENLKTHKRSDFGGFQLPENEGGGGNKNKNKNHQIHIGYLVSLCSQRYTRMMKRLVLYFCLITEFG
jgi:hypothetical protein